MGNEMTTTFLDVELHKPDIRSSAGGGWIISKTAIFGASGSVQLASHCASVEEFEFQISQMQKDLEELRKEVRRKFEIFAKVPKSAMLD